MEIYWVILAPLLAALLAPTLVRLTGGRGTGLLLSIVPFGIVVFLLRHVASGNEVLEWTHAWMPTLGVDLSLRISGYETLFLLLVSFIGGLIVIYAGAYLKGHPQLGRFYLIILLFMASMLGIIAADDMLLLFVFWELTSITSFLLVGFKHTDPVARKAALQALLVTGGGGLALLAGLLMVMQITGTNLISALPQHADAMAASPLFPAAFILILLGAFTKSAQVPFHFWLPGAMAAPTPVSAYLHSATMVKAGVILLAKLWPSMSQHELWTPLVAPVGAATLLTGAVLAVLQTDLKKLLAYTTVSILGALTMLLGFGDSYALKTALLLALSHGLYKGSLFMVAGTIDHATGTRDVRRLSGLLKAMPLLAVTGVLAALSMSGVPPTLGFISKELLYEAQLEQPSSGWLWLAIGFVASAFGVTVALIVGVRPFFGKPGAAGVHHAPGLGMVLPPTVLAVLGLVCGLLPGWVDSALIGPAAGSLGGDASHPYLTLWHGFTIVLALSALTLLAGYLAYRGRERLAAIPAALSRWRWITPTALYDTCLDGTLNFAARLTLVIQNGQLRHYVRWTLVVSAALIIYAAVLSSSTFLVYQGQSINALVLAVVFLLCVTAIGSVLVNSRLTAILCLGGVGYAVAMLFAAFAAPDLAITQLLVETLTVVLFSFVILKLPEIRNIRSRRRRSADMAIAAVAGLAMAAMAWQAMQFRAADSISPGLVERSVPEAFGRNVVNVILVDFRALDTLGEILVLALAGVGVVAVLASRRRGPRRLFQAPDDSEAPRDSRPHPDPDELDTGASAGADIDPGRAITTEARTPS